MDVSQQIAGAFSQAPFSAGGWNRALNTMASLTRSMRGQLIFMGQKHLQLNICTEVDETYHADFLSVQGYRRDVNWRIGAEGAVGEIIHEGHYDAVRAIHTDEAYLGHARRFDAEFGIQTVLARGASGTFDLACLRTGAVGRSEEADRAVFTIAMQQARLAIRTQIAMEEQGAELLAGSLESLRVAALLIDGQGRVCGSTPTVTAILASGAFRIKRRMLAASHPRDDALLQARLAMVVREGSHSEPDLWVRISGKPCLVEVNALPRQDWAFGFAPRAIITFRFPVPLGREDAVRLAAALPLTMAEAEVVALLTAGLPRSGVAAARGTSVATVNSQLRTIFSKCAVQREAELVALAVTLLAPR